MTPPQCTTSENNHAGADPSPKAQLMVVDDHPIFCQGLADLINGQPDLACCSTSRSFAEAAQAMAAHNPHLVLIDLRIGTADGLDSIKALRAQFPAIPLLVVSQCDEMEYAERALRAGASGYVMKEQASEVVLQAARSVLGGQCYVSARISMMAVQRVLHDKHPAPTTILSALSDRELHVFKAVGEGMGNKQIAAELHLSVKTIETYREHIKYKLGLANGVELVALAKSMNASQSSSTSPA